MADIHNERIKLLASFVSNIGVGLLIIAMVLPMLPIGASIWTLAATMAGLLVAGLACVGWAIWFVGRLRP